MRKDPIKDLYTPEPLSNSTFFFHGLSSHIMMERDRQGRQRGKKRLLFGTLRYFRHCTFISAVVFE